MERNKAKAYVAKAIQAGVRITVSAQEDDQPLDPQMDPSCHEWVREQRAKGNDVWSWANVTVTASFNGFKGEDYLSGCMYESEADFANNEGYCLYMCVAAIDALREELARAHTAADTLEKRLEPTL